LRAPPLPFFFISSGLFLLPPFLGEFDTNGISLLLRGGCFVLFEVLASFWAFRAQPECATAGSWLEVNCSPPFLIFSSFLCIFLLVTA